MKDAVRGSATPKRPEASRGRRGEIEEALLHLAPRVPDYEFGAIVDHALDSPGLARATPGEGAWLALTSYVRHAETDYDALLVEGYDAESARFFVLDAMREVLDAWGVRRPITADPQAAGATKSDRL